MNTGIGNRESGIGASDSDPAVVRLRRLEWRCRRGTRELDALLGGWLDRHGADMDTGTIQAFDALLDQQDPELWDWIMGHAEPPRDDWRMIVAEIRMRAGLAP